MNGTALAVRSRTEPRHIGSVFGRNWAFFFLVALVIAFSGTGKNFFALTNFQNIVSTGTIYLLLACAETFVLITGGVDLSVGYVMGLSSVSSALGMQMLYAAHWSPLASILAGILIGLVASALCGLASGVLVARFKVPSLIATLGVLGVAYGVTLHLSGGGFSIGFLPPVLTQIGNGFVIYVHNGSGAWGLFRMPEGFAASQVRDFTRVIPNSFLFIVLFVLVLWYLLKHTRFGQHTYAIGGSMDAAIRSGLNVRRHLVLVYVLSAFLSGLAGVFNVFQTGMGNYTPMGANLELEAIAAVVIGGASLMGGKGRIMASVVGVLVLQVLENGLTLSGVEPFYRFIAVGLILIAAVVIDQLFPDFL